ncbi:MAG: hypothetical protein E5W15_23615 [Mesorhizobium sp.]|nr:MAG: hypothetical protein E5W15_23615 [Mesorhizobium sp.]
MSALPMLMDLNVRCASVLDNHFIRLSLTNSLNDLASALWCRLNPARARCGRRRRPARGWR